jgi:hypothetical protein
LAKSAPTFESGYPLLERFEPLLDLGGSTAAEDAFSVDCLAEIVDPGSEVVGLALSGLETFIDPLIHRFDGRPNIAQNSQGLVF